jgi:hypothetical protein
MLIEEIEAKELAIANLNADLSSYKYITLDCRPCEIYTRPNLEKFRINAFQLLDTTDGHFLFLDLAAEDGDSIGFSIPDIIEILPVDKETENEVNYKLKSFVRRFSRGHIDIRLARTQIAATNVDKMTLAYHAFVENTMHMTHEFTLSNE